VITRIRIEVPESVADEAARRCGIRARKRALKRYCAEVLTEALQRLAESGADGRRIDVG